VVDGIVKVWVTASPTDGQANLAVCELLAKKLGLAKSRVSIVRGDESSRDKQVIAEGLTTDDALLRLES
jgi:uncharacterized protein